MSRRGNSQDNAVAECFLNQLKRERIRRHIYKSRPEARQDAFDYIEILKSKRQACEKRDAVARRIRTTAENNRRGSQEDS